MNAVAVGKRSVGTIVTDSSLMPVKVFPVLHTSAMDVFVFTNAKCHIFIIQQLKGTREGIALPCQQLYELDCLLKPLLKQGQSISYIYDAHEKEIPCSIKIIYNYIDQGIFTAQNIDLPKK